MGKGKKTYKAPTKVFFLFCTADEILLKAPFLFKWKIREIEIFITQALEKRNIMKKKFVLRILGMTLLGVSLWVLLVMIIDQSLMIF